MLSEVSYGRAVRVRADCRFHTALLLSALVVFLGILPVHDGLGMVVCLYSKRLLSETVGAFDFLYACRNSPTDGSALRCYLR
jgi:hypothetical protein